MKAGALIDFKIMAGLLLHRILSVHKIFPFYSELFHHLFYSVNSKLIGIIGYNCRFIRE